MNKINIEGRRKSKFLHRSKDGGWRKNRKNRKKNLKDRERMNELN